METGMRAQKDVGKEISWLALAITLTFARKRAGVFGKGLATLYCKSRAWCFLFVPLLVSIYFIPIE